MGDTSGGGDGTNMYFIQSRTDCGEAMKSLHRKFDRASDSARDTKARAEGLLEVRPPGRALLGGDDRRRVNNEQLGKNDKAERDKKGKEKDRKLKAKNKIEEKKRKEKTAKENAEKENAQKEKDAKVKELREKVKERSNKATAEINRKKMARMAAEQQGKNEDRLQKARFKEGEDKKLESFKAAEKNTKESSLKGEKT